MGINDQEVLKPREKAIKYGFQELSDEELLAIIISKGSKSLDVFELAHYLMKKYQTLENLSNSTIDDLSDIVGIKNVKAIQLLSVFEFHKRIDKERALKKYYVKCKEDALVILKPFIYNLKNEKVFLILLDNNNKFLNFKEISIGTSNKVMISANDVITYSLKYNAKKIYIAHNHPSDNVNPSKADEEQTTNLKYLLSMVGVLLIDHLIITSREYYSFTYNQKYNY